MKITCLDCTKRAGHYYEFTALDGRPPQYQALCLKCSASFNAVWISDNIWWIRRKITKSQYITRQLEAKL